MATVRCGIFPYSEKYLQSALQAQQQRGENPNSDNIPSHEMTLSHTDSFVKAVAMRKDFIDAAIQRDGGRTQGLATQNPNDENSMLFRIIRRILNNRVAQCYIYKSKDQQTAPESTETIEASAIQPFNAEQYQQQSESNTGLDDLPF